MSKKNRKDVDARFKADRSDVLEYAGPDALCAMHSKAHKFSNTKKHITHNQIILRAAKRKSSHNGKDVSLHFESKPKRHDNSRETIRRPAYLDYLAEKEAEGIIFNYLVWED